MSGQVFDWRGVLVVLCLAIGPAWAWSATPATVTTGTLAGNPFQFRLIDLHMVTGRLKDLRFDDDGIGWIGTGEAPHFIIRFDPKTNEAKKVSMDVGKYEKIDSLVPCGGKIFICGSDSPKQIIFDVKTGRIAQVPMKYPNPLIYDGQAVEGFAYLVDFNHGLYRWNPKDDSYEFYAHDNASPWPCHARYDPQTHSLYCFSWWQDMSKHGSMPLIRFDVNRGAFAGNFLPPWPDAHPLGIVFREGKLYTMDAFKAYLMVFDLKTQKWVERYKMPGYDKFWHWSSAWATLGPYVVCNLSTFQGIPNKNGTLGFDGKDVHFVNKLMVLDTHTGKADAILIPSLSGKKYNTISYLARRGDLLYGTCVDSTVTNGVPNEQGESYLVEMRLKSETR